MGESAIVLFSGGQDSATCLAWALSNFETVETIGFDYGQNHSIELEVRQTFLENLRSRFPDMTKGLGIDHMIDLGVLGAISDTALTGEREIEMNEAGLPNTFVPGRNLLFLTIAAAVGYRRNAKHLVGGMCETDYSGYPDCRDDTLKSLQVTLGLGMDTRYVLHTPLMWIDKAETWEMARGLGGDHLVDLIVKDTHTCYRGDRSTLHAWGYGCNDCPACELRASGWSAFADVVPSEKRAAQ
ncbi:7-cyano-7-deazaguanine synthase QueC [Ruegeria sp. HKCCSP335]|uniref:7-cyano-7-deazaguanine synthase QueC n=1 Tax=Ruegeria sp. HKCCSP335 TaxID=2794833 RepID=UPI001AE5285C|nr:7-cyano-7-deazaguanine synthase QueC [Ruegeria sp. HKCCSP335]